MEPALLALTDAQHGLMHLAHLVTGNALDGPLHVAVRTHVSQYSTHTTIWDMSVCTAHVPLPFGTCVSHPLSTCVSHPLSTVHTPPQFGTHINQSSTYCDTPPQFGTLVIQDSTHTTTIWHTVSTIHMSPPFGKLIQYGLNMRISHLITKQHRYMLQLYTINPMTVWPTFSSTTDSYHLMTSLSLIHI